MCTSMLQQLYVPNTTLLPLSPGKTEQLGSVTVDNILILFSSTERYLIWQWNYRLQYNSCIT